MGRSRELHVVVAGAGAAATEALFVLREHAQAPARVTLVAPPPDVAPRVLPTAEGFSAMRRSRRPLRALASDMDAELLVGRVAAVDGDRHLVHLADGRSLGYDALVLAIGARPRRVIERGLTFYGEAERAAVERLTTGFDDDDQHDASLAFFIPPGVTRSLALYELAVQVGMEIQAGPVQRELTLWTPERAPLEGFGLQAQVDMRELLDDPESGTQVVALPVLEGPRLPGVPATAEGFIPIDGRGAVPGLADVYAAGDATACPVKHVDVACAQAGAVADALAARAGAHVTPRPWRPVVREHQLADLGIGALSPFGEFTGRPDSADAVSEAHAAVLDAMRALGVAAGIPGARKASVTALAAELAARGLLDPGVEREVDAVVKLYDLILGDAMQRP